MTRLTLLLILCAGSALAQVRIQELLYDGPSTDADDVFTELIGPAGTSLESWSLVGINGGSGAPYRTVPLSGEIPPDGVYVVATESAHPGLALVRDHIGNVDWQNGPDAVQLLDAAGTIRDAVQYGAVQEFNAGEGQAAPTVSSGQSLSRDADGTDTGDNATDFSPLDVPTPGFGPDITGDPPEDEPPDDDPPPNEPPADEPPLDIGDGSLHISLPDTTMAGGDTLTVPIHVTDTSGFGVLATELSLGFDSQLLSFVDVQPADLVDISAWHLAAHVVPGPQGADTLRVALATDIDTLAGAGALLRARFAVHDLRRPQSSPLSIAHLVFNDGGLPADATDGTVALVGTDATVQVLPEPLALHQAVTITVVDPDADRQPAHLDSVRLQIREGPELGPTEQLDEIAAVETGPATGTFVGAIATAFADGVSANGRLEFGPRRHVQVCYTDSLDAAGQTTDRCVDRHVPAHTGSLSATRVIQPGDTVWVRLIDADLNRYPDSVDSVAVQATHDGGSPISATLRETSLNDSVFFGFVPTADTTSMQQLQTHGGQDAVLTYHDSIPASGEPVDIFDSTAVLSRFGDADGNGLLQAFDAARTLAHVLAPQLSGADSLSANVDSLAPFGPITPLDAALILQQRVGLRQRFPVQASPAANHPGAGTAPAARRGESTPPPLALRHHADQLSVHIADGTGVIAADIWLAGANLDQTRVLPNEASGRLVRWRHDRDSSADPLLRIVLAAATAASDTGALFRLQSERSLRDIEIRRATINDIDATVLPTTHSQNRQPAQFTLHRNHPNPFNSSTVIPIDIDTPGHVRLTIHDVLGRRVRALIDATHVKATRVHWDGRNDAGHLAATGVYVARLTVGSTSQSRRMLLLR